MYQIIYGWIASGKYKPGDTLPSQDELAKQFKVSRVTLREALFRLSALGFVSLKQGVGTEILPVDASNFMSSLPGRFLKDPIILSEFLEARLITEKSSIRLAVKKATDEDLQRIEEALNMQKQAMDNLDFEEFVKNDLAFHQQLVRAAHNSVLFKILQTIWDLLDKFTRRAISVPGNMEKGFAFHSSILQAIKERDANKAARIMHEHIKMAAETTLEFRDKEVDLQVIFSD
ncbi:hypothetical protein X474_27140 [Dethiosulfatarculus sandiegensis]|uniref:HTH gntR-type domain-containing protein n=1 Tax=Dethiosulfatarculus sandiegensis TaxID=1429043 RepID=A0A0D2IYE9_9BACT|nr:hypothetical protein X474_27140 [Dethiosulfatarculus sandiegensis]